MKIEPMSGKQLKLRIGRAGISQAEAARRIGVLPRTVTRWIHSQHSISLATAFVIREALKPKKPKKAKKKAVAG